MVAANPRVTNSYFKKLAPKFYSAIVALGETAEEAGLDAGLLELVFLRASQINGCAYCVQYHIKSAQSLGVSQPKLNLVVTWREAGIFSEREEAALAWAEALTLVADTRVPDDVYEATRKVFSEFEMACLTAAISTINVWNRLCVSYRFAPEI